MTSTDDPLRDLERLQTLFRAGILTQAEFETQRDNILNRATSQLQPKPPTDQAHAETRPDVPHHAHSEDASRPTAPEKRDPATSPQAPSTAYPTLQSRFSRRQKAIASAIAVGVTAGIGLLIFILASKEQPGKTTTITETAAAGAQLTIAEQRRARAYLKVFESRLLT